MDNIRPISDLRNKFTEISKIVHETNQPIYLTKNGYGDMVVMSMETYQKMQFQNEMYFKLAEAEREAENTTKRYTSQDILDDMRGLIDGK